MQHQIVPETTPLYVDDAGNAITTHSMLKTFGRCPKQTDYKYNQRLKPRIIRTDDKPLHRGTWFHKLLEEYYAGRSWRAAHKQLVAQYGRLFDEEKDALGDLPAEMEQLMKSYLWHYGADKEDRYHGWKVHETELTLEAPWPDGNGVYRMRLDALIEDDYGLAIVDHKSHVRLPDHGFRLRDKASALYIWCALANDIPVYGFIWNYVLAKAPTKPALVDKGTRLSRSKIVTDFPTAYRAIKEYGLDIDPYRDWLRYLKSQRWQGPDHVQSSPFFRRDTLEKDDDMLARVMKEAMRTRDRMHGYDWTDPDAVERVVDRSCGWCRYSDLCTVEMFQGVDHPQAGNIRRQQFRTGDPLDYYYDEKPSNDES
jgi:hypothetical protein